FTFLVNEFAGKNWGSYEIYAEEENGDTINDAVYKRNRTVEAKLGIEIKEIRADYNDTVNLTKKSVSAGDDAYGCVMPRMWNAANMASEGYLLSLDELPYVNLKNPWWDQNANGMSLGGRMFFTVGDLMVMDKDSLFIVMFNKKVAADGGIENLYALVRENKWTMEKFYSIIKEAAKDLDGSGTIGFHDVAGLLSSSWCISFLYYGTGETVTGKDDGDYPYFRMNNERGIRAVEKSYEIIADKSATLIGETLSAGGMADPFNEGINKMFQEDRGLFMLMQISYILETRTMESDFGILPTPKLDEAQDKYYTPINPVATSCIAVPATVGNREKTSVVLEALSAESRYTLMPAYYDVTITNKMIRDEESAEMLDLILGSRVFDLGFIFNWGSLGDLPTSLYPKGDNFVSAYEKLEPRAIKEMEKTIEAFKNLN
ncbi:MAG: extracellular solute-binding protein, partial [Oscillospiraceae bacterium]|nr:extracellular solute-binding protein [Oscillospiraceae bacterium]